MTTPLPRRPSPVTQTKIDDWTVKSVPGRELSLRSIITVKSAANSKTPTKLKDLMLDVDEKPRRKQSPAEIKAMLMLALGGPKATKSERQ